MGNLYIADSGNHRIRKITPKGVVTTVAGSSQGFEDGNTTSAKFNTPYGVAVGLNGDLFVADTGNHAIRRISADGVVSTFSGGVEGFANGSKTTARFRSPFSLVVDPFGTLFIADAGNHAIRMTASDGTTVTLVGNGQGFADGLMSTAKFFVPNDVALDLGGQLVVADFNNHAIRQIDRATSTVQTLIGTGIAGSIDGNKASASLNYPTGIATDPKGRIFIADNQNHRIRMISTTGEISTLVGQTKGLQNGPLGQARFSEPTDLVAIEGNLFVADTGNNLIRKITIPSSP